MLPRCLVGPRYPEPTVARETISAVCCKPRSPMSSRRRPWETRGAGRLSTERGAGTGRLVFQNQDFIRAMRELSGNVVKKKLESAGYSGYPVSSLQNLMSWAHGRGTAEVFRPFPRFSRTGSLRCPRRMV